MVLTSVKFSSGDQILLVIGNQMMMCVNGKGEVSDSHPSGQVVLVIGLDLKQRA